MTTVPVADTTREAPIGQLIEVDGYPMHSHVLGEGSPTVVMEAPLWDVCLTWSLVQPEVAKFTCAITYDRAGYGWSAPSPGPRHGEAIVEELPALLQTADVPTPYVLVGQSFSGMLIRLFAYRYPREVAGLVLVDSAHEDQDLRFPEEIQAMAKAMTPTQVAALRQMRDVVQTQGPATAAD